MAKLVLSRNGRMVQQCFIDEPKLVIGRDRPHRIVIDDPTVSRDHAAIVTVGNDHILEDLASVNGTIVNGTMLKRRILQHGDTIAFGAFALRYLNPKVASDVDLDRTRLLSAGALPRELSADIPVPPAVLENVPATPARTGLPEGRVWMGAGPRAGAVIELTRIVTVFGRPGAQAVVTRRPLGFFVTHVVGRRPTRVNGSPVGMTPRRLRHGDIVEAGGERLEVSLDRAQ
ncbi:MAG TPA: FHA domain-containing protein [Casimicrobiaceae bacterium]|nr:FHA domain-containing protein [Casimicrobiaceae bacterium]